MWCGKRGGPSASLARVAAVDACPSSDPSQGGRWGRTTSIMWLHVAGLVNAGPPPSPEKAELFLLGLLPPNGERQRDVPTWG